MKKKQDRIDLTNKICLAAIEYKDKMVGKTFLYVFENRYIEVLFRTKDFLHLTGVETNLSAKQFYKDALKGILRYNQIYFNGRHPYNLAIMKINQLVNISKVTDSELIILEEITTSSALYKFGITELDFTLCLGQDTNDMSNIKSDIYTLRSLRAEDCFNKSNDCFIVNYILCKSNEEKYYKDIMYIEGKHTIENLPIKVQSKLNQSFKDEIIKHAK